MLTYLGRLHSDVLGVRRRARVVADARGRVNFRLRAKPDSADMDSLNVRETGASCSCVLD